MNKICTVGELKEYLNKIPDDAFIYYQIGLEDKYLYITESKYRHTDDGRKTHSLWSVPNFMYMPLSNEDTIEYLTKQYNRIKENDTDKI